MSTRETPSGRRQPPTMPYCLDDAPEIKEALARAQDFSRRAAAATDSTERDYCERMYRKWLGIADGWRVIVEVDKAH
jgi:hypothetical protein